jgi:hypothetical protein
MASNDFSPNLVIPAKAGIQKLSIGARSAWTPAFAGVTASGAGNNGPSRAGR